MTCHCSIVPHDVLIELSKDQTLPQNVRAGLADAAGIDAQIRKIRGEARKLTRMSSMLSSGVTALATAPAISVFDCKHGQTLPGSPVGSPGSSADKSARQAHDETKAVADFFDQEFGRKSIDGAGMALLSSIHYGTKYNNAMWTGTQMVYGDGDGQIFLDFTGSVDVVCHELVHGVTQHTLQLVYANESGGLNESMSDVFGSMFRQWRKNQTVNQADWLIGKDIMGPLAKGKGITCLRDMSNPGGAHCLAPQPFHFSKYVPGMGPHTCSGIPNFAFHNAAMAIGGRSWQKAGKIWYHAMTSGAPSPNMKMQAFANRTRQAVASLFPGDAAAATAVDQAWQQVGL